MDSDNTNNYNRATIEELQKELTIRGIPFITKEQAQTPEQIAEGHGWRHLDDIQAKELAVKLGLAS